MSKIIGMLKSLFGGSRNCNACVHRKRCFAVDAARVAAGDAAERCGVYQAL